MLGGTLTEDQQEILFSLVSNRRTAAKASHAIGKTFLAACAACWWYDCWDEHIVYITAPTWPQALGLTFKQIKLLRRQRNLPGRILESGRVLDEDPNREPAHFIRALNAESGEGFQGEHTAPILIILEEAVGVPSYIWEASDGLMTVPECRMLAIANPTEEGNQFGAACAGGLYNVISINGLKHPNIAAELAGEPPPYPKAVRLAWIEEMITKECEPTDELVGDAFEFPEGSGQFYQPNAVFQGRVLGDFPSQADAQIIPRGWLASLPELDPCQPVEIGCDVARKGRDRTVIAVRSGPCVVHLREIRKMDVDVVAGALINTADEWGPKLSTDPKKIPIRIDVTGGLGVAPAVMVANAGYHTIEVNSSSTAIEKERYPNKRSELWFTLRERARTKDLDLSFLPDEMRKKLVRELSTPTWNPDSRGRKVAETKDKLKERLGESPDLADAVNLAFDGSVGNWSNALPDEKQSSQQDFLSEAATVKW